MSGENRLTEIRDEIDQLDEQIQQLISQRAALAQEVAETKLATAEVGTPVEFYRPEREAQVLAKVMERNRGPLGDEEMARLFREVMSACLALEEPMRIAFLGPEGTFTQAAALKQFGHSVNTLPMATIPAVFHDVESDQAHYGVVPVENSTEGVISHTLDMFINSPLRINGEVELRIHHYLMSQHGDLGQVKRVYSHQQSLAQCRDWMSIWRVPIKSPYPVMPRRHVSPRKSQMPQRLRGRWPQRSMTCRYWLAILKMNPITPPVSWWLASSLPPPVAVIKPHC